MKLTRSALALGLAGLLALAGAQEGDIARGEEVFLRQCASCHQASGEGVAGVFPELAGNPFVTGEAQPVIDVVVHGRGGMPAFGTILDDESIAAVVSYIRGAWENDAEGVSVQEVAAVRAGEDAEPDEDAEAAVPEDDAETDAVDTGRDELEEEEEGGPDDEEEAREDDEIEDEPEDALNDETDTEVAALPEDWQARGAEAYTRVCAACHQAQGEGVEDVFPALAGNPFVLSSPTAVIAVVLHGRGGMPRFAPSLSDEDIALILSHVRTAWDNEASLISADMVAGVREGENIDQQQAPVDPLARPGAGN